MMKTKDRILDKALELMNTQGMENVSTYDIARALDIRQSNITYYFPTKSHIINALAKRLIEEVDQAFIITDPSQLTLNTFYWGIDSVMQVHQKYHFLMMNYAPIITSDPELNQHFVTVLQGRHAQIQGIISLLAHNGYLKGDEMMPHSYPIMLMQNILVVYWIQEAAIYSADKTDEEKRRHHLAIFFQSFVPYLTEKGEQELKALVELQEA